MRLVMIRHGRPKWQPPTLLSLSRFNYLPAKYDAAHLSEEGTKAISALSDRLPKGLILSSDLPRARETAEILGGKNRNIEFDSVFRELRCPHITLGIFDKLYAPLAIWSLVRCCCWILGLGKRAETPRIAWRRVTKAVDRILKHFEIEETIILVSHGWFITLLAIHLRWRGLVEQGPLSKSNRQTHACTLAVILLRMQARVYYLLRNHAAQT